MFKNMFQYNNVKYVTKKILLCYYKNRLLENVFYFFIYYVYNDDIIERIETFTL